MRTTVSIDPDVLVLLRKAMRERGEPFKQVLNAALRQGLRGGEHKPAKPFRPMKLPDPNVLLHAVNTSSSNQSIGTN